MRLRGNGCVPSSRWLPRVAVQTVASAAARTHPTAGSIRRAVAEHTMSSATGKGLQPLRLGDMRISLNDIQRGVLLSKFSVERKAAVDEATAAQVNGDRLAAPRQPRKAQQPYIKIVLRISGDILLYEQRSVTALRDTDEGRRVEADNRRYAELVSEKGRRQRRTADAVTQTALVLRKSRDANTELIRKRHMGAYVSNYEMFDTYKDLETSTQCIDVDGSQRVEVTTYTVRGVDTFATINRNANFRLALMLTLRTLAGNVYEQQQRRFRNMALPDPLAPHVHYRYRLELLWRFRQPQQERRAVADLSWCPLNGDILAAAYGTYSYTDPRGPPSEGHVCVWNIKNPVNPERYYRFGTPVVSVEFSPYLPQLLAVGLHDGSVQVLDITQPDSAPVAVSVRTRDSLCFEPITAIRWIPEAASDGIAADLAIQPFLALSQDGSVTKFRIIKSPALLAFPQVTLHRVEGKLEGIPVERAADHQLLANRNAQGLDLCLQPQSNDLYYILSDEGCIHKCSTNYPQQHLEVMQAHRAAANTMEFSPWSPILYLTCGNDWCIHIWMVGICQPIITLQHGMAPVHSAGWSKTHSTILVSVTRSTIDVWDLKRSALRPVSSTTIDESFNTLAKLSMCGRSIAVGKEDGNIAMLALEDMPFPPHFQYKQLKAAICGAVASDVELAAKVRSLGYFGYPRSRKPKRC